jgi:Gluconate 2-dehydrogenase subunit 3
MGTPDRAADPSHLPKRGGDTSPGPPAALPAQRRGTTPQMRGRYPDYDVLTAAEHWDPLTRRVVLERVANVPTIRFFTPAEERALRAFCDVVTGQSSDPRIPVLEMVDAKLHSGQLDGYRYEDMPADPDTWRRVAANLDATASQRGGGTGFADADTELQHQIVESFSKGELDWELSVGRVWSVVMRGVLGAFYSHPWAWSEIGFGGPAYPRGYARLGPGQREHWEAPPEFSVDPVSDVPERGVE